MFQADTNQATRRPSNQNTLAARRNSLLPSLCPGQTSLLNGMKKSRIWQAIDPGTQTKPQDTLQIRKTPWHGVTKQPPAVPLPGPNVTPEPNEKIKGLAGNCSRHTKQATRHPSNQENTLARRLLPYLCPGQTSLLNRMKKFKGLAGNCSRHTKQATRHPSNQENTLARRDETASCRRQLFQAHKTSHKTPFKSGKHPGTA